MKRTIMGMRWVALLAPVLAVGCYESRPVGPLDIRYDGGAISDASVRCEYAEPTWTDVSMRIESADPTCPLDFQTTISDAAQRSDCEYIEIQPIGCSTHVIMWCSSADSAPFAVDIELEWDLRGAHGSGGISIESDGGFCESVVDVSVVAR